MRRTSWVVMLGMVVGASLQSAVMAADGVKAAAGTGKVKLGVESPAQANTRFSRFKLDIAKGDPAPAASGALTVESMNTMLENMGYEPKVGQYSDGGKYITANVTRGIWTISVSFDLSPDKSKIWLSVFLTKVNDPTKVPLASALKLLDAEANVWPSYFAYSTQYNTIYIYRPLQNADVKPAVLRATIDAFMTNIDSTSAAWESDAWNPK